MSIFSKVLPCIAALCLMQEAAAAEEGPSFDCARAATAVEGIICAVPELARLDQEVARAYEQARAGSGDAVRARLLGEQRAWLSARDACGPVPDCLSRAMKARIADLSVSSAAAAPAPASAPIDKGAIRAVQGVIAALGNARTPFVPDGIPGPNTRAGAARVTAALGLASGGDDVAAIHEWLIAPTQTLGHFRGWADCGGRLEAEAFLFDVAAPDWNSNAFLWIGAHGFRAKAFLRAGGRVEVTATDVWPATGPRDTTFRARGRHEGGEERIILDSVSGGVARQRCREIVLMRVLPLPASPQESAAQEIAAAEAPTAAYPLPDIPDNARLPEGMTCRAFDEGGNPMYRETTTDAERRLMADRHLRRALGVRDRLIARHGSPKGIFAADPRQPEIRRFRTIAEDARRCGSLQAQALLKEFDTAAFAAKTEREAAREAAKTERKAARAAEAQAAETRANLPPTELTKARLQNALDRYLNDAMRNYIGLTWGREFRRLIRFDGTRTQFMTNSMRYALAGFDGCVRRDRTATCTVDIRMDIRDEINSRYGDMMGDLSRAMRASGMASPILAEIDLRFRDGEWEVLVDPLNFFR